jgi:hypothetical protein
MAKTVSTIGLIILKTTLLRPRAVVVDPAMDVIKFQAAWQLRKRIQNLDGFEPFLSIMNDEQPFAAG